LLISAAMITSCKTYQCLTGCLHQQAESSTYKKTTLITNYPDKQLRDTCDLKTT